MANSSNRRHPPFHHRATTSTATDVGSATLSCVSLTGALPKSDVAGYLMSSNNTTATFHYEITEQAKDASWEFLIQPHRPANARVRALFVENMSGPVLQMLGAYYNIEPFFFSSSLSWIPSRFQEEVQPGRGDRKFISGLRPSTLAQRLRADITITLTFLKTMDYVNPVVTSNPTLSTRNEDTPARKRVINTQTPLVLRSGSSGDGCSLVLDLLAVHLIRNVEGNTLISYHNNSDREATSALFLQERMHYAGQSVYWQNIFQRSPDPTFVLLISIWVAICAWDEALESRGVTRTHLLANTSDIFITHELHIVRVHCFQFPSLSEDVRKAVLFLLDTPNPAMDTLPLEEQRFSRTLLEKECRNLLSEIHRLEMSRRMQDQRLKNALNLMFSTTIQALRVFVRVLGFFTIMHNSIRPVISELNVE
ncbi:uncharacterized protein ARMOST_14084 [Armillaria ostoyae]|uniref:Uncharacterized protein n=1 Tax=Armillaria ostoyae TaxID=47428 RepID=A0A284RPH8_ARMOS|nr:uncharacterized protein ARMOST_14084 [Armillaria ostoyae]